MKTSTPVASYDDKQLGAVLMDCPRCGRPTFMTKVGLCIRCQDAAATAAKGT